MKKIKKIITAIGNPTINEDLKEENYDIVCADILYKEGILEFLEINNKVDYIIINDKLEGKINTEDLIEKIKILNKNIKIILISKNEINNKKIYKKIENISTEEIKNIISCENIKYNNNKINYNDINNKNINNNINYNNKKNNNSNNNFDNKKNNNKSLNESKIFNRKTIPINDFFNEETKEGKLISILGTNGIGKSIFSIIFSNNLENKKVLIINFDIFNNSLINLLKINKDKIKNNKNKINNEKNNNYNKIKKYNIKNINDINYYSNKNNFNINNYIINSKYKIDFIFGAEIIFNSGININPQKLINIINKLKNKYDLILIDTSSDNLLDYTKEILKNSDYGIFISGANLLEIKKSQKLLDIYTKEWGIYNKNIKIIINKWTKESIDDGILKEIFKNYDILGKIKLSDYYDLAINKNNLKRKEIQKDLNKIKTKIVRKKIIKIN